MCWRSRVNRLIHGYSIELYKNGKCSSCRGWIVDILIDNNILPDWMAQECLYDSNFDIHQSVADYLNSKSGIESIHYDKNG